MSRDDAHRTDPMGLGWPTLFLMAGLVAVTGILGPAAIPIWGMTLGGLWVFSRSAVGQALAHRITGHAVHETGVLDVPAEVYAELDELRGRLAELEERTDFAERLLASRPDQPGAP
ncbi:MAG: hypothetical protein H0W15_07810 [Gemmatimonadales bacterium]|nr:hypothetical protein [Gemmatimonadales bacterium]